MDTRSKGIAAVVGVVALLVIGVMGYAAMQNQDGDGDGDGDGDQGDGDQGDGDQGGGSVWWNPWTWGVDTDAAPDTDASVAGG